MPVATEWSTWASTRPCKAEAARARRVACGDAWVYYAQIGRRAVHRRGGDEDPPTAGSAKLGATTAPEPSPWRRTGAGTSQPADDRDKPLPPQLPSRYSRSR